MLALMSSLLLACSSTNVDPLESINRPTQAFNDTFDRILLRPAARGYQAISPEFVEVGVSNFFSNLGDPLIALNQLLQGKPNLAVSDIGRFVVNSTLGIAGLVDVADTMGLEKHQEDFGQTLAVWGVEQSPYLVIPFLGPSTIRDGASNAVGAFGFPPYYIDHVPTRNQTYAVWLISQRAALLGQTQLLRGDRYLFLRDAYLQQRNYNINDGVVDDPFLD
jgi:phospholipid-binding lipoprotein MlaA